MYKSKIKINGYLEFNTFTNEQDMYLYVINKGLDYIKNYINLYSIQIAKSFNDYHWFQDFLFNYNLHNPQLIDKFNEDLIILFIKYYPEEVLQMGNNITAQRILDEYGYVDLVYEYKQYYHMNFCNDLEYNDLLYVEFEKFIRDIFSKNLYIDCINNINDITKTMTRRICRHTKSKIKFECIIRKKVDKADKINNKLPIKKPAKKILSRIALRNARRRIRTR